MKRVIGLILVLVLLGSAVACGTKAPQDTADSGRKAAEKEEA